jgi:hypothetical protein
MPTDHPGGRELLARDGTRVQMVVEMGEATINGETTDGWLRAVAVETVP